MISCFTSPAVELSRLARGRESGSSVNHLMSPDTAKIRFRPNDLQRDFVCVIRRYVDRENFGILVSTKSMQPARSWDGIPEQITNCILAGLLNILWEALEITLELFVPS